MKNPLRIILILNSILFSPMAAVSQVDAIQKAIQDDFPSTIEALLTHPDIMISTGVFENSEGVKVKSTLTKAQFKKLQSTYTDESRNELDLIGRMDTIIWLNTRTHEEQIDIYFSELTPEEIKAILAQ